MDRHKPRPGRGMAGDLQLSDHKLNSAVRGLPHSGLDTRKGPAMSDSVDCILSDVGSGPVIFMVHGIGARRSVWDPIIERLSGRFRCISYDLRGHGDSPVTGEPMTLDDLIADLEALRARLGIDKAHVIGHSLGGMIGPAYAKAHPDRVLSLGILSTAAFRTEDDSRKVQGVVANMRQNGVATSVGLLTQRWFSDAFAAANPDVIASRIKQVIETPEDVFLNVFDIYATTEMSPWLHEVTAPSLVLTGAEDGGCPPRLNTQIAAALPDSDLVILDGLKHAILLESPDRVADALDVFFSARSA